MVEILFVENDWYLENRVNRDGKGSLSRGQGLATGVLSSSSSSAATMITPAMPVTTAAVTRGLKKAEPGEV
jgi:hypothetical protein|tara:strand:- start:32 stop:244 length:213 start_codon:yes stop_codon:yes gene_type:complete